MIGVLHKLFLAVGLSTGVVVGTQSQNIALADEPGTVLITGSSRGVGFELVKQYAVKEWKVIATCRTPSEADDLVRLAESYPNVIIEEMDVTDVDEIEALAKGYAGTPIDVLINNAGIFGTVSLQRFEELDYSTFVDVMAVNVFGPLKVTQAFADSVAASEKKKIVTITSGLGSMTLTEEAFEGYYFYRASKASVNIIGRTLAADLRDRGILIGLFNPGIVDTGFGGTNYDGPKLTPEEAVAALIGFVETLSPDTAATMINYDGVPMPW